MTHWNYEKAFSRNLGLISPEEQQFLRRRRVAIVGQGGVGGVHLITLARLGIGGFTIADPDVFDLSNTNRQYGATASSIGVSKTATMARIAKDINPEIDIRIIPGRLNPSNVNDFFQDADLFLDGIDAFEIDTRRLLFRKAAEKGIFGVTAGPLGFSTGWLVFDPKGMSFDRYFDLRDEMSRAKKFASFLVGLAPKASHRAYLDMSYVSIPEQRGPSVGLACQLAAGVAAGEIVKILLKRGPLFPAPWYRQFDVYWGKLITARLIGGNRHPLQQLKRWLLTNYLERSLAESGPE